MKKRMRVLILVFLAGMILGAVQPAMLFAGETQHGFPWDVFVYPQPFAGTKLSGPLSIYYLPCGDSCFTMYYTVRLSKGFDLYLFQGSTTVSPVNNLNDQTGAIIIAFLGNVVVPGIFTNGNNGWALKSIENGIVHDETIGQVTISRAFAADISIAVKEK